MRDRERVHGGVPQTATGVKSQQNRQEISRGHLHPEMIPTATFDRLAELRIFKRNYQRLAGDFYRMFVKVVFDAVNDPLDSSYIPQIPCYRIFLRFFIF